MLPDVFWQSRSRINFARSNPDRHTFRRTSESIRIELLYSCFDVLDIDLKLEECGNSTEQDPAAFFSQPRLLLRQTEDQIEDLDPAIE